MKLSVLHELYQEVNRLMVAGSRFAKGDMRLSQQLPRLKALADKAPALGRLVTDLEELLVSTPEQSPDQLLALSQRIHAILLTQTLTESDEPTEALVLNHADSVGDAPLPYSVLAPQKMTLKYKKNWRIETLKEATSVGAFSDPRLFPYMDQALEEASGDSARTLYIQRYMVKQGGQAFERRLLRQLAQGASVIPRLRALASMSNPEVYPYALPYLEGDQRSKEALVLRSALRALAGHVAYIPLMSSYLKHRIAGVQVEAFSSLMHTPTPESLALCQAHLQGIQSLEYWQLLMPMVCGRLPPELRSTMVEIILSHTSSLHYHPPYSAEMDDKNQAISDYLETLLPMVQGLACPELFPLYRELMVYGYQTINEDGDTLFRNMARLSFSITMSLLSDMTLNFQELKRWFSSPDVLGLGDSGVYTEISGAVLRVLSELYVFTVTVNPRDLPDGLMKRRIGPFEHPAHALVIPNDPAVLFDLFSEIASVDAEVLFFYMTQGMNTYPKALDDRWFDLLRERQYDPHLYEGVRDNINYFIHLYGIKTPEQSLDFWRKYLHMLVVFPKEYAQDRMVERLIPDLGRLSSQDYQHLCVATVRVSEIMQEQLEDTYEARYMRRRCASWLQAMTAPSVMLGILPEYRQSFADALSVAHANLMALIKQLNADLLKLQGTKSQGGGSVYRIEAHLRDLSKLHESINMALKGLLNP